MENIEEVQLHCNAAQSSQKGTPWCAQKFKCAYRGTCVGDVRLETQAQVRAFGAKRCRCIVGSLVIAGTVTSLEPLSYLEKVTADIFVQNNASLTSLRGLERLRVVGN